MEVEAKIIQEAVFQIRWRPIAILDPPPALRIFRMCKVNNKWTFLQITDVHVEPAIDIFLLDQQLILS